MGTGKVRSCGFGFASASKQLSMSPTSLLSNGRGKTRQSVPLEVGCTTQKETCRFRAVYAAPATDYSTQTTTEQIADIFAFGRFEDLQNWTTTALPLIYELERLAPALSNDGPNPEYPWPHLAPQNAPATFDFPIWRQLTETGRGRQLLLIIKTAIDQFPIYG